MDAHSQVPPKQAAPLASTVDVDSDTRAPSAVVDADTLAATAIVDADTPSPTAIVDADTLAATDIVDADHPAVRAFAEARSGPPGSAKERAIRLFYAVRDEIRYDPYGAAIEVESLRASATLDSGRGWCVSKSVLLAAACRAVDIPARLGFADVRNHLSTERMREHMKTDVFYWHGYTSIFVGEATGWVKATPAFNIELCEKFGFLPLEFDGEHDSLYHPFDREGRSHMEYVHERGEFADVPLDDIRATFAREYASLGLGLGDGDAGGKPAFGADADFDRDVEVETAGSS